MEGASDLHTKYQKLATEYSKLRAQLSVLKNAVLEERTTSSELRDIIKEREQSLRKADQEIDSLTFRNQQLTKRVTILQEELDSIQTKSKKGKGKSEQRYENDLANHVLDEEFQSKIAENARLLTLMEEKDAAHRDEVNDLKEKLQELQQQVKQHHQVNNDAEEYFKTIVENLEKEKLSLLKDAEFHNKAMEQLNKDYSSLQEEHFKLQTDMDKRLETANRIIEQNLPFIDTRYEELNELNVPRLSLKEQINTQRILTEAEVYVREFISALSDYHTYVEQRLHVIEWDLSDVNLRFSKHLKENAKYLRALEQGYSKFQGDLDASEGLICLETLPALKELSSELSMYTSYLSKLLSYQILSLEQENSLLTTVENLEEANKIVMKHARNVTNFFVKLNTYVKLLAAQSRRTSQHSPSSQRKFLLQSKNIIMEIHEALKDLCNAWNTKISMENDMPTSSDRLRTTNTCLMNALTAMISSLSKISNLLVNSNVGTSRSSHLFDGMFSSRIHPVVATFKKKAVAYMKSIALEEAPSVPYKEALRLREEMQNNVTSRESLSEQLSTLRQQATKLEQEKEHWKLEFQLLKLKHTKRVQELEGHVQSSIGSESAEYSKCTGSNEPTTITNMLGRLDAPMSLISNELESREREIKTYFVNRINELIIVNQESHSKAVTLSAECSALQKLVELSVIDKKKGDEHLQEMKKQVSTLQEELKTTTENYESQLSIMSEHLANMNDKLTTQQEEIDQLKFQLHNKPLKKGKQK